MKGLIMVAPHTRIQDDPDQALLIALRPLLSKNLCAPSSGPETLSEFLFRECYLSRPVAAYEVEGVVEALRVEGEVLA